MANNLVGKLLKANDLGTYKTKDGKVITHDDLPDNVKERVKQLGAIRDLTREAAGYSTTTEKVPLKADQDKYQKQINRLYDPATRDQDMMTHEIQQQLENRLSKKDKRR